MNFLGGGGAKFQNISFESIPMPDDLASAGIVGCVVMWCLAWDII